jgi:hypothetical protein
MKKALFYLALPMVFAARLAFAGPTLMYAGHVADKDTTIVVEETTSPSGKVGREIKFFQKGKVVQTIASDPKLARVFGLGLGSHRAEPAPDSYLGWSHD